MASALNVLLPKASITFMPPAISGSDRMDREVASRIAHRRPSAISNLLERILSLHPGHDPELHADLVLHLDRPPPGGHRLDAEGPLGERGPARGGERGARQLHPHGYGHRAADSVQAHLAGDLQLVRPFRGPPARYLPRTEAD